MGGAGTVGAPAESAEGPSDMAARSGDARERRRRMLASAARRRAQRTSPSPHPASAAQGGCMAIRDGLLNIAGSTTLRGSNLVAVTVVGRYYNCNCNCKQEINLSSPS